MGVLGILFQVAQTLQTLLVTHLHAAQVEHGVLHGHGDLLALAGLLAADDGRQDTDGQVHAGVAVTQGGSGDGGLRVLALPPAGGRGGAAGALGHVFVDLQVFVVVAVAEALDRSQDHAGVELLDVLPGETHAVQGAGAEVLDHDVGLLDQLLEHFLALGRLGVQGQRTLVAVEHREVERVGIGDVTQLAAGDVAGARTLDLDHVSAEPGQQLGAGGTGLHVREVDDLDALEGFVSRHVHFSFWVLRL
jgi:hypothetical protein